MNDVINLSSHLQSESNPLEMMSVLLNFIVCLIVAFTLRYFYIRHSWSLTGKQHIGSIIPMLSAIVFLVIVVVKSSLALSLGLVGALSIVRFRTPIKEPEELIYLFLAIAIGLGYGAGHLLVTSVLVSIILLVNYLWLSNKPMNQQQEYNYVIRWSDPELSFDTILAELDDSIIGSKLTRLELGQHSNTAIMLISPKPNITPSVMLKKLQQRDPRAELSLYESNPQW